MKFLYRLFLFLFLYGAVSLQAQVTTPPVIDGTFDGISAWGSAIASDGDASWQNVSDLTDLYVTYDNENIYFGITYDLLADWLSFGIVINTIPGGGSAEPWGYPITFAHADLPDFIIKGHFGQGGSPYAELRAWTGSDWNNQISTTFPYSANEGNEALEFSIPRANLGYPSTIDLQFYITGNNGAEHAVFDAIPDDELADSWNDSTILDNYAAGVQVVDDFSVADGNWTNGATWQSGTVPPAEAIVSVETDVLLDADTTRSGSTTITSGNSLTVNSAGDVRLILNGGLHNLGAIQVNGSLEIGAGGYVTDNSPVYGAGSALIYSSGGEYGRFIEWNGSNPADVRVRQSTTLILGNIATAPTMTGDLQIESASAVTMGALASPLTLNNLTNNGTLTLSSAAGGDVAVGGNIVNNGTFTPNGRAVFFTKDGIQSITDISGAFTAEKIVLQPASGSATIQLANTDLILEGVSGEAISFSSANDMIDLAGSDLTINGGTITGSGKFTGNDLSSMTLNGTGALGTITFETGSLTLDSFTLNRTSGSAQLGSDMIIQSGISIDAGTLVTDGNTVTLGSGATITETPGNTVSGVVETRRFVPQSVSVDFGGMGFVINAAGNAPDTTLLTRVTGTFLTGDGNESILRYFDVVPSVNAGLDASITFSYDESELQGFEETSLMLFESTDDGVNWTGYEFSNPNPATNSVSLTGVDDLSLWTVGSSNSPLPVELSLFTAHSAEKGIKLEWKTETESNNYGFEVERSQDKRDWQKLAFVEGSVNSNAPVNYSYVDKEATAGVFYYRLKQVDVNGKYEYSKIVEAEAKLLNSFMLSENYPNPFNPETNIKFAVSEKQQVEIKVYNSIGKEVGTLFNGIAEANQTYSLKFNGAGLASGIYFYRLSSDKFSSVKKMILMK